MNNQPTFTEIKRVDGTTLVLVDDPTEGRYIALFDQHGGNLQHISIDDQELALLKSWASEISLPVQSEPSEEERIEARAQHWQERKAIEADYIHLP